MPPRLEALRYLARTLDESAILLVVTYRDDEITRRHELYQLLPLLVRESQAQRLHLHHLDRDDIREMVAGRYELEESDLDALVEHVCRPLGGQPLLRRRNPPRAGRRPGAAITTDDCWTLGNLERARVPMLLRQTLDVRLARLGTRRALALRVAAVIGHVVPIELWQEVVCLEEASSIGAMTEAIEAHVSRGSTIKQQPAVPPRACCGRRSTSRSRSAAGEPGIASSVRQAFGDPERRSRRRGAPLPGVGRRASSALADSSRDAGRAKLCAAGRCRSLRQGASAVGSRSRTIASPRLAAAPYRPSPALLRSRARHRLSGRCDRGRSTSR